MKLERRVESRMFNMGIKHLTDRMKAEYLNIIIERDEKFGCFYCSKTFSLSQRGKDRYLYEHLNNNRTDNRIDNVVLSCYSCNNKKPDNIDMQFIADGKLIENEKLNYMGEKFQKKQDNRQDSEVQISKTNYQICRTYIIKNIDSFGEIDFKDTMNSIVYQCRENNNTGSQQATYNYLNILCCNESPFEIVKNSENKRIIRRKKI
jgi:hypothetical protein